MEAMAAKFSYTRIYIGIIIMPCIQPIWFLHTHTHKQLCNKKSWDNGYGRGQIQGAYQSINLVGPIIILCGAEFSIDIEHLVPDTSYYELNISPLWLMNDEFQLNECRFRTYLSI